MDFRKPKTLVASLSAIIAVLIVLTVVIAIVQYGDGVDYYGTNKTVGWGVSKTVGWGWDLYNFAPLICFIILVLLQLGYILLWILRVRLNRLLSIFNLITLFILLIVSPLDRAINAWLIILFTAPLSILLFLTNTIFAIVYKISDKKEKQKP